MDFLYLLIKVVVVVIRSRTTTTKSRTVVVTTIMYIARIVLVLMKVLLVMIVFYPNLDGIHHRIQVGLHHLFHHLIHNIHTVIVVMRMIQDQDQKILWMDSVLLLNIPLTNISKNSNSNSNRRRLHNNDVFNELCNNEEKEETMRHQRHEVILQRSQQLLMKFVHL